VWTLWCWIAGVAGRKGRYVGPWKAAGEQRDRVGRIINSEIALVPGTDRMFPRWSG
jgi:hypothetical protein